MTSDRPVLTAVPVETSSKATSDAAIARSPRAYGPTNEYRSNRRRAWAASLLIGLSTVLFASGLLVFGLINVGLGITLARQGVDAYNSMVLSAVTWAAELGTVMAIGALVMAVAGLAFLSWLARSIKNLHALAVPGHRRQAAWSAIPLFALSPALLGAFIVVSYAYPESTALQVALYVAAVASLVNPLILIRRLWAASFPDAADASVAPVWRGVWVWWGAYLVGWIAVGLSPLPQSVNRSTADDAVISAIASGFLEMAAAMCLVVAAVLIVRIMFSVNAMQKTRASVVPQPDLRRGRRPVAPAKPSATQ